MGFYCEKILDGGFEDCGGIGIGEFLEGFCVIIRRLGLVYGVDNVFKLL